MSQNDSLHMANNQTKAMHQQTKAQTTEKQSLTIVWDAGIRAYHWSQATLVSALLLTGFIGEGSHPVHSAMGLLLATILIWRWLWFALGSSTAKITRRRLGLSPMTKNLQSSSESTGHNPLAAWMALTLICGLSLQALSGLLLSGFLPTPEGLSGGAEYFASTWHHWFPYILSALITMHIAAALFHGLQKDGILVAIFTGQRYLSNPSDAIQIASNQRAIWVFVSATIVLATTMIIAWSLWA